MKAEEKKTLGNKDIKMMKFLIDNIRTYRRRKTKSNTR